MSPLAAPHAGRRWVAGALLLLGLGWALYPGLRALLAWSVREHGATVTASVAEVWGGQFKGGAPRQEYRLDYTLDGEAYSSWHPLPGKPLVGDVVTLKVSPLWPRYGRVAPYPTAPERSPAEDIVMTGVGLLVSWLAWRALRASRLPQQRHL